MSQLLCCYITRQHSTDSSEQYGTPVPSFIISYLTLGQNYDSGNLKTNGIIDLYSLKKYKSNESSGRFCGFIYTRTLITDLAKILKVPPLVVYEYFRQMQLYGNLDEKHFFYNIDGMYCYYGFEIKREVIAKYKSHTPVIQRVLQGSWYIILLPADMTSCDNLPSSIQKGIKKADPTLFENARFLVNSVVTVDFKDFLNRIRPSNTAATVDVQTNVITAQLLPVDGKILDQFYFNLQTWRNYILQLPEGQYRKENTTNYLNIINKPFCQIIQVDYDVVNRAVQMANVPYNRPREAYDNVPYFDKKPFTQRTLNIPTDGSSHSHQVAHSYAKIQNSRRPVENSSNPRAANNCKNNQTVTVSQVPANYDAQIHQHEFYGVPGKPIQPALHSWNSYGSKKINSHIKSGTLEDNAYNAQRDLTGTLSAPNQQLDSYEMPNEHQNSIPSAFSYSIHYKPTDVGPFHRNPSPQRAQQRLGPTEFSSSNFNQVGYNLSDQFAATPQKPNATQSQFKNYNTHDIQSRVKPLLIESTKVSKSLRDSTKKANRFVINDETMPANARANHQNISMGSTPGKAETSALHGNFSPNIPAEDGHHQESKQRAPQLYRNLDAGTQNTPHMNACAASNNITPIAEQKKINNLKRQSTLENIIYCSDYQKKDAVANVDSKKSLFDTQKQHRPKPDGVRIPVNDVIIWASVFSKFITKNTDSSTTQPIVTINNIDYIVYFVTFDAKKVLNPSNVAADKFKKHEYFISDTNGKLQMLACYLCRSLLQTNGGVTLVRCYCGTYPAKEGYQYTNHFESKLSSTENIKYSGEVPEYRVILVGASGKGKSTLINGLASYSKHDTLAKAVNATMKPIIPVNFRVLKKFKQHLVIIKTETTDDYNEDFSGGGVRSTTQKPKRHLFNLPGAMPDKLTFIDTPGINDTRGHKMDDQNIEYIKRALIEAQYVHAVCFVLSANDIKMITSYETVLRRLLSLVPKDALKNVVFFFNSTRGTNYGIGDSIEPLMCIFKNLANYGYNVHFVDDNVFFFENDCFRYLCAAKCGHAYSQNISFEEFEESWEVNRKSYRRFVHYLSMLEPVNGTSFDRLDTASKWLAKFEGAFDRATFNKGHSDQISTLINVLKKESSLSVDEQLVLFTQLSYLLPADLHDSIQNYRNLRMAA